MCGRYTLTASREKLKREFELDDESLKAFRPRYNIAPRQPVPALIQSQKTSLEFLIWGLIPSWAKDPEIGNRMINARKETLAEKPSFRGPFKNQRCLILADGFYEWKQEGRRRIPYYICLKSRRPFTFAGLWSNWMSPSGSEIRSCAIITGEPNQLVLSIHHRMPIIISEAKRALWLDRDRYDPRGLAEMLVPYPADEMEAYPVSERVNSPEYDVADCVRSEGLVGQTPAGPSKQDLI